MAERPQSKPEIASQKRVIKLPPAIGDWTAYRPPKVLVKKIKSGLYGFDRLGKDELNAVLIIHYRFIQSLLKHFKVGLGMGVEFLSCQVEQTTYLNFLRTLTGPVAQGKLSISAVHETVQVFFDLNLASSVINYALGSKDLEAMSRGLTGAENEVFSAAFSEYISELELAPEPPSFSMAGSPDVTLDPSVNPSSTFVFFSAEIALGDNPSGKVIFGYPGGALKTLLKIHEEKEKAKPLNFSRLSAAILGRIMVNSSAVLGKTVLSTSELNRLEAGDVVSLDTPISSAVSVTIGNFLKLLAQPGNFERKRAARIAGFGEEEEIEVAPPLEVAAPKPAPAPPPAPEKEPAAEEPIEEEFPEEEEEFKEEDFEEDFEEEFPEEKGV